MWLTTHKSWSSVTHSLVQEILQSSVLESLSHECVCNGHREVPKVRQPSWNSHRKYSWRSNVFSEKGETLYFPACHEAMKWMGLPLAQSQLKISLEQPSLAPNVSSFYRDIWYCCCPCQCIFLILFVIFVKLPHRILVHLVRIYEQALKQKTCRWISTLSHTLITSHLEG